MSYYLTDLWAIMRPLQNAPFGLPLLRDVRLNILHEVTRSEASALTFSAILKILNVFLWLKFSPALNLNPATAGSIFQRSHYIHEKSPVDELIALTKW